MIHEDTFGGNSYPIQMYTIAICCGGNFYTVLYTSVPLDMAMTATHHKSAYSEFIHTTVTRVTQHETCILITFIINSDTHIYVQTMSHNKLPHHLHNQL